jgi:hypothetical protein
MKCTFRKTGHPEEGGSTLLRNRIGCCDFKKVEKNIAVR